MGSGESKEEKANRERREHQQALREIERQIKIDEYNLLVAQNPKKYALIEWLEVRLRNHSDEYFNSFDVAVVDKLLADGGDVNVPNKDGETALDFIVCCSFHNIEDRHLLGDSLMKRVPTSELVNHVRFVSEWPTALCKHADVNEKYSFPSGNKLLIDHFYDLYSRENWYGKCLVKCIERGSNLPLALSWKIERGAKLGVQEEVIVEMFKKRVVQTMEADEGPLDRRRLKEPPSDQRGASGEEGAANLDEVEGSPSQ